MGMALAPAAGSTIAAAADRARERAALTSLAVPLCWTEPVDGQADAAAFFASADAAAPRTLWLDGQRGVALAGSGTALLFPAGEGDRFAGTAAALRAAQDLAVAGGADGVLAAGLVALGGFAFDPQREAAPEWSGFPAALMAVPEALLRVGEGGATVTATVLVDGGSDPAAVADRVAAILSRAREVASPAGAPERPAAGLVAHREVPPAGPWKSMVAEAAADVRAGRFDKVVLARSERIACAGEIDVAGTLHRMAASNPAAMIFAVGVPGAVFLGASPETLVELDGGRLRTTPLAGSIARGATREQDEALARRLLRSGKDRIEHDVVVGAILQALDPVCLDLRPAPEAPLVVKNRTVQHLATPISGRVRPGVSAVDIAGRLHPTPAVGGYPADAALAAIRAREGFDRGWYAGPVGWCGPGGDGCFCIGIRSALVRGNEAILYAGCGIVADSDPDTEYAETCLKLGAIGAALGVA
ncbi:MAG: isochorismate synthase MenF [Chloroflexota bacterium]